MRPTSMFLALLLFVASPASGQNRTTLEIYVVDVEGGNAVLFLSPSGESMLVDSGNGGEGAARDAGRILAAAKDAGIQQIDHLITTHYHGDHIGGLSELASRINTRRETVSREINAMEREGLIQRRRGAIVIIDALRLSATLEAATGG